MTQTMNDDKNAPMKKGGRPGQRQQERLMRLKKGGRPGQRQQERLMRLARRRKRQRITISVIVVLLLIGVVGVGYWQYQQYNDAQTNLKNSHATATAVAQDKHATATAFAMITPTPSAGSATPPAVKGQLTNLPHGLEYIDVKTGTGAVVSAGSSINVQYTGWLQSSSKKFDSSYDHGGQPFNVTVGQGQVIPGWDEGLVGMKVGGTRRLIIPPALAYGSTGSPPTIPANATLIFDVTVVS
jgi:FKBP-type peptidyl-prolyl cis-trans isomerase